jgi:hypothetical protein
MGLNDDKEKRDYAWTQLKTAELDSEDYNAAYEYLYDLVDDEGFAAMNFIDAKRVAAQIVAEPDDASHLGTPDTDH